MIGRRLPVPGEGASDDGFVVFSFSVDVRWRFRDPGVEEADFTMEDASDLGLDFLRGFDVFLFLCSFSPASFSFFSPLLVSSSSGGDEEDEKQFFFFLFFVAAFFPEFCLDVTAFDADLAPPLDGFALDFFNEAPAALFIFPELPEVEEEEEEESGDDLPLAKSCKTCSCACSSI